MSSVSVYCVSFLLKERPYLCEVQNLSWIHMIRLNSAAILAPFC